MCVSVCIIMCVFIYVCEHLEFQEMKRGSGHSLVVELSGRGPTFNLQCHKKKMKKIQWRVLRKIPMFSLTIKAHYQGV